MARRAIPALVVLALAAWPAAATAARPDVAALQVALHSKGLYASNVDGVSGPLTRDAVRRFQARRELAADGIAGPQTRRALGWRGRPRLGGRVLAAGAHGWDVAALQFMLARHGFPSGPFDGRLGRRGAAFHTGTDYPAAAGAAIGAAGGGCVESIGFDPGGYGNFVVIAHRAGMTSWYAHLADSGFSYEAAAAC